MRQGARQGARQGTRQGADRMVVGTLNLGSETGLQFKVPTTMRRHGVMGAQTGSKTEGKTGSEIGYNLRSPPP